MSILSDRIGPGPTGEGGLKTYDTLPASGKAGDYALVDEQLHRWVDGAGWVAVDNAFRVDPSGSLVLPEHMAGRQEAAVSRLRRDCARLRVHQRPRGKRYG